METKELLFNLIKKLDSGEIRFLIAGKECVLKASGVKAIKIGEIEEVGKDKTPFARDYEENYQSNWNKEFKENFYKEKGLNKCWVKECPNKIYQKEGDYKKAKVPCSESHTRMVCLNCFKGKK
ncbi:protein of unknown function [endosymbiont DhMRE of Dentiscutata heterogama]|uniref:hypothetical protein n=1 Tax=endosymbiont DhMRE of Dentiscutata heterogama TaxID=1609546 RepID=UPI000629D379|nr:hypothetical protein [endosymbiont DhMRE of Dentiscutata heterogama]CFW92944.1 protein of unknown function [endosymbiont DhMRE of Dentiscutata heterogama]